jgi:hypothetical protein
VGSKVYQQPTSLAFASQPFTFWRGDIVFTFEFVISNFHRGKFGIGYEPNSYQSTLINTQLSLNKQYIDVIDIQETQCVSVRVKWASARPWLKVGGATSAYTYSGPNSLISDLANVNGYIFAFPFTDLQSPDSSDISVNVYVHGENMHYNGLSDINLPNERFYFVTESCERSVEVSVTDLNESTASDKGISEYYFGEEPVSFRSLLKRFVTNQWVTISPTTVTAPNKVVLVSPILPDNLVPYASPAPGTLPDMDLFSYLRYAYLGIRGGVRIRIHNNTPMTLNTPAWAKVSLLSASDTFSTAVTVEAAATVNRAYLSGTVTFVPSVNGGFDVEFPYYSNNLFQLCFADSYEGGVSTNNMEEVWFRNFRFAVDNNTAALVTSIFEIERAAGEDFTLMRFQGATPYTSDEVA